MKTSEDPASWSSTPAASIRPGPEPTPNLLLQNWYSKGFARALVRGVLLTVAGILMSTVIVCYG